MAGVSSDAQVKKKFPGYGWWVGKIKVSLHLKNQIPDRRQNLGAKWIIVTIGYLGSRGRPGVVYLDLERGLRTVVVVGISHPA